MVMLVSDIDSRKCAMFPCKSSMHPECVIFGRYVFNRYFVLFDFFSSGLKLCQWLKWGLVHCSLNVLQWLESHKRDSIKGDSVNHLTGLSGHGWLCVCVFVHACVLCILSIIQRSVLVIRIVWNQGGSMHVNTLLERLSSVNRVYSLSKHLNNSKILIIMIDSAYISNCIAWCGVTSQPK